MMLLLIALGCSVEYDILAQSSCIVHGQGFSASCNKMQRLPDEIKNSVSANTWSDAENTAGFYLKFTSTLTEISIAGAAGLAGVQFDYMQSIGTSSFDLYHLDPNSGYHEMGHSSYGVGSASWGGVVASPSARTFMLFLPNFQKLTTLKITSNQPITFIPVDANQKKIVIYGGPTAHGQSVNRPGLTWVNWLIREMESEEIVNLGFSKDGNKLDTAIIGQIAKINAKIVILDCATEVADLTADAIKKLYVDACKAIRAGSGTSACTIIIIEHPGYGSEKIIKSLRDKVTKTNTAIKAAYDELYATDKSITYITKSDLHFSSDDFVESYHPTENAMRKQAYCVKDIISTIVNNGVVISKYKSGKPVKQVSDAWWQNRFDSQLEKIKEKPVRVQVGDSITQFWGGQPQEPGYLAKYTNVGEEQWEQNWPGTVNLGLRGDRIQNLLYRIHHGLLDGYTIKKMTLLIGVNSFTTSEHDTRYPHLVVDGERCVYREIKRRQPTADVTVVAIYPANPNTCNYCFNISKNINPKLRRMAVDDFGFKFMDPGVAFYTPDETVNASLFIDQIHPNKKGYALLIDAFKKALDLDS